MSEKTPKQSSSTVEIIDSHGYGYTLDPESTTTTMDEGVRRKPPETEAEPTDTPSGPEASGSKTDSDEGLRIYVGDRPPAPHRSKDKTSLKPAVEPATKTKEPGQDTGGQPEQSPQNIDEGPEATGVKEPASEPNRRKTAKSRDRARTRTKDAKDDNDSTGAHIYADSQTSAPQVEQEALLALEAQASPTLSREQADQYAKENIDLTNGSTPASAELIAARNELTQEAAKGSEDVNEVFDKYIQARNEFLREQTNAHPYINQKVLRDAILGQEDRLRGALQASLQEEMADQEYIGKIVEHEEALREEDQMRLRFLDKIRDKVKSIRDKIQDNNLKPVVAAQVRWQDFKQAHAETFFSNTDPEKSRINRRSIITATFGALAIYGMYRGYETWQGMEVDPGIPDVDPGGGDVPDSPETPQEEPPPAEPDTTPEQESDTETNETGEITERGLYLYGELVGADLNFSVPEGSTVWDQLEDIVASKNPEIAGTHEQQRLVANAVEHMNELYPEYAAADWKNVPAGTQFDFTMPTQ